MLLYCTRFFSSTVGRVLYSVHTYISNRSMQAHNILYTTYTNIQVCYASLCLYTCSVCVWSGLGWGGGGITDNFCLRSICLLSAYSAQYLPSVAQYLPSVCLVSAFCLPSIYILSVQDLPSVCLLSVCLPSFLSI